MTTFQKLIDTFDKQYNEIIPKSYLHSVNKDITTPLEYFLNNGGKRFRPLLCFLAHEIYLPINQNTLHAANAIELFHNFTLIHDDIMDNSLLRRNHKTVNHKYGINTAILSGDALMIVAYEELSKLESSKLPLILKLFNKVAMEVCCGQQMDMLFEKRDNVSMEDYIEMIRLKTSVLLAFSLKCGALLGNASLGNADLLYQFGIQIGLAFQILDDYLDAFGQDGIVGKKIGGDIIENKKTFLYIKALELASETTKSKLLELRTLKDETKKINQTKEIFQELKIEKLALQKIEDYYKQSSILLEEIVVEDKKKNSLREILEILKNRKF